MARGQYFEGKLGKCRGVNCDNCCCDDDQVEEWIVEYFAFHERIKDYLKSIGIGINYKGDRVEFKNCSDGKDCKFLKHSLNKDFDPRPIDCKIYPFVVDWDSIDFDKKIVSLYYWDDTCPLITEESITAEFKKEVEDIIKRDFSALFYGAIFSVKFMDKIKK
ncbi:hypothetical protein EPO05_01670 [Patescibacteria group bacterium]|nr:MAG: hypothetical protein EPO05_01670 [Patescibacteria group bacterium]